MGFNGARPRRPGRQTLGSVRRVLAGASMEPDPEGREDRAGGTPSVSSVALQWSPTQKAGKTGRATRPGRRLHGFNGARPRRPGRLAHLGELPARNLASMEPDPEGREDPRLGQIGAVGLLASMEPDPEGREDRPTAARSLPTSPSLQWSPTQKAGKTGWCVPKSNTTRRFNGARPRRPGRRGSQGHGSSPACGFNGARPRRPGRRA